MFSTIKSSVYALSSLEHTLLKMGQLGFKYRKDINYKDEFKQIQLHKEYLQITYQEPHFESSDLDLDIDSPYDYYLVGTEFTMKESKYRDFQTLLRAGYIKANHIKVYKKAFFLKAPSYQENDFNLHYFLERKTKPFKYEK